MTKHELRNLVVEEMRSYLLESKKRNTVKRSELKGLIKEVVRQCVKEAGPQYKVRGKKSQLEQPGLRNKAREMQCDPTINEEFPVGEDEFPATDAPESEIGGDEHTEYNEQDEIRLIKAMGQAIIKLLQMHRGMDEPESGEESSEVDSEIEGVDGESVPDVPEEPIEDEESAAPFPPKKKAAPKKDEAETEPDEPEEDELDEAKTQNRSYTTAKDGPQNPKNVRDSKVPMTERKRR